jgi:hypothetical protein
MKERSAATCCTPANSVMLVVYSFVASMTAALSGPYDSTLKAAMIGPWVCAATER